MINGKNSPDSTQVNTNLTIRGITHKQIINYELLQTDDIFTASGSINIDRTDYNIRYGSGKFFNDLSDKMIYDDFSIHFKIYTLSK